MNSMDKWFLSFGFAALFLLVFGMLAAKYLTIKEKELQAQLSACGAQHITTTDSKQQKE